MYFGRIKIGNGISNENTARLLAQDAYQDHKLVWNFFSGQPDAKRDFVFRREQVEGWPCFYVVSGIRPEDKSGLWKVETKDYEPQLVEGQVLRFNVRANAVISKWEGEGANRRQVRHDVVMDAKKSLGKTLPPTPDRPSENDIIQEAAMRWLQSRCADWGFSVSPQGARVDNYSQHRVYKSRGSRPISFSTIEYTGVLRVEVPDLFKQTLYQGIGKSKGLGCGLLLVRPANG